MSIPQPFPEDILEDIRLFDGNNKCCDCPSLDTDWASVSHGTLICLDCAGKHRSLGVHVSFVRSITMDTWSPLQIEMMKQGGNSQIRRFFKRLEIENSPLQTLYCTKAAEHYREKLRERVDKVISGEIVSEKRSRSEKVKPQHPTSPPLPPPPPTKTITANVINARFNAGPMGMTLTKDFREQAYVSKLVPGGQAQQQGIKVGDIVIAVAGKTMASYDEIMHMIPLMPRPLDLNLTRVETSPSKIDPIHHSKSDTALVNLNRGLNSSAAEHVLHAPVAVPAIRGTKIMDNLITDTKPKSSRSSSHPMKQGTKAVKLLRKGARDVAIDDENEVDSEEGEIDLDDDNDADDADNQENNISPRSEISKTAENTTDVSPSASATSHESAKSRNPLEPGSVIKVLKPTSGKWKTAMIKRRHKDNTFKVIYKDGTEESHVTISRLAVVAPQHQLQQPESSTASTDIPSSSSKSAYEIAMKESILAASNMGEHHTSAGDFVVASEENLDAWIERDFQDDFSSLQIPGQESYFAPKDVANNSVKDREISSINSGDFVVDFPSAPLGLTLSTNTQNEPEVIRLRDNGTAMKEGVQIGDIVVLINGIPVHDYDEAMQLIANISYPVAIHFRRPAKGIMAESSESLIRNSKIIATQLMDTIGLSKDSILSSSSKNGRLANTRSNGVSSTTSTASPQAVARSRLDVNPGPSQFDVHFDQQDLGFGVQERIGAQIVSVVVDVADKGEAKSKGVSVGCVIVGINFEPYLSHAHTVATLKYAKRPVVVRFMK